MLRLSLQLFGGRGTSSKMFTIPSAGDMGNYSQNALIEQLPNTIGEALGKKGAPKSIKDSYENANPFYSAQYSEYSENCQRCVVAYEMRRRGYDVEAQPTYDMDQWPTVAYTTAEGTRLGRWRGAFRHAVTDDVGVSGRMQNTAAGENKLLSNIMDRMKEYGAGSRAVINFGYRGSRMGHVFNVENQGGSLVFVDAQTGERYTHADMRSFVRVMNTASVGLTRTDNLRVSARMKEFVWNAKERKRK